MASTAPLALTLLARDSSGSTRRFTTTDHNLSAVSLSGSYRDLSDQPSLKAVALSGSYLDLGCRPLVHHGRAEVDVTADKHEATTTITFPRARGAFSLHAYAVGSALHPRVNVYVTAERESGADLVIAPHAGGFIAPDRIAIKWCVRA